MFWLYFWNTVFYASIFLILYRKQTACLLKNSLQVFSFILHYPARMWNGNDLIEQAQLLIGLINKFIVFSLSQTKTLLRTDPKAYLLN